MRVIPFQQVVIPLTLQLIRRRYGFWITFVFRRATSSRPCFVELVHPRWDHEEGDGNAVTFIFVLQNVNLLFGMHDECKRGRALHNMAAFGSL